jgi:thiamine biosynthesis lipoprotein
MKLASDATGGSFDPTFLHQLLSTGYTSSIDDPTRITIAVDVPSNEFTVHDVRIDLAASRVFVPTGLSLDPGGIGKGFAADLVVTELLEAGTGGALVGIGGDIAAAGTAPTAHGWIVNVEDPHKPPSVLTTLALSDGGITTSSTRSRRWLHRGLERHHVIDPATGTTSRTDLAAVTVVAKAAWLAEAHATAALLRGSSEAISYLHARGLSGLAVSHDGEVTSTLDIRIEPATSGAAR